LGCCKTGGFSRRAQLWDAARMWHRAGKLDLSQTSEAKTDECGTLRERPLAGENRGFRGKSAKVSFCSPEIPLTSRPISYFTFSEHRPAFLTYTSIRPSIFVSVHLIIQ
jgi:hypothetical protein